MAKKRGARRRPDEQHEAPSRQAVSDGRRGGVTHDRPSKLRGRGNSGLIRGPPPGRRPSGHRGLRDPAGSGRAPGVLIAALRRHP